MRLCLRVLVASTSRPVVHSSLPKVVKLLREPDPRLLPDALRRKPSESPPLLSSLHEKGTPNIRSPDKGGPFQEAAGYADYDDHDGGGDDDGDHKHALGLVESQLTPRSGETRPCIPSASSHASGSGGMSAAGVVSDWEEGAGDHRAVRERTARRTEARGREGGDLREVRRSALVSGLFDLSI